MNLLALKNVYIKGKKSALNLTLHAGEKWAILGPNGCGKSTLLHTIMGLNLPLSGEIFLKQQRIQSYQRRVCAKIMGLLFQEPRMSFPQSVWQYCATGLYPHAYSQLESKQAIKNIFQQVEWKQDVTRCITTLSGGEKKRLAIAKLFLQQPEIFLLDEPTNHLDIYHQHKILNHLHQFTATKKTAFMLATHDMNIAQHYCDHAVFFYPDNTIVAGPLPCMMTEENLSKLYQQPIACLKQGNKIYWVSHPR